MARVGSLAWLLVSLGLSGCGGTGDPDVTDPEVWAERITGEEQLLRGRTARGELGDYRIFNSSVAFVIQDVGLASGYRRYGGGVADGDVFDADGNPLGATQLGELFFGFNQRLFEPAAIEVVPPDFNDGRAMIRVTGQDAYFDWLGAYLSSILSMDTIDSNLTYEYSLGPDDEALRIDVYIENRGSEELVLDMAEVAMISGDGLKAYFEGPGFDVSEHWGEFPYWLAQGQRLSYGLLAEEGSLTMLLNMSNIAFGVFPRTVVRPGRTGHLVRHLVVAEGGLAEVQRIFRKISGRSAAGTVSGRVSADPEALARGVRIHVLTENEWHRSLILADADGAFSAELAPGDFFLVAKADGFDASEPLSVQIVDGRDVEVDLLLPSATRVDYRITDDATHLLPARLTFLRLDDVSTNILPPMFGEEYYGHGGAALVIYPVTGEGGARLPDGTYEVVASRGFEYEVQRSTLVLMGQDEVLDVSLAHVVDSSGYLSGDFHIHGQFSPDSSVDPDLRVRTAMSEGVELLVMTEHDTVRDFSGAVAGIPGADRRVHAVIGSEITTYMYGHFNAWPLTEKPDRINNGGIEWFETPAPALVERIRQSEDRDVVVQVNHPRSVSIGGYFSAVKLDIDRGTYERDDWWTPDFDSIEVFNGGCSNGNQETVLDWFDFLNRGYRVSIGGGSDSHYEYHPLGTPRVYVPTDHGPADFDPYELVPAFVDQRVFVSCGPFVSFSIDGHGMGDLISTSGPLAVHVQVQAPSWMDFSELRIIRNGEIVWSLPAVEWTGGDGAIRHDDTIELQPDRDAWYVLEVTGTGRNPPASGQTPYALTNPIYVDHDGNGAFDPPLPKYRLEQ